MIDTVMALWNREFTEKGVKLFSVLLALCISISLLLVMEDGPTGSNHTYALKNGFNAAQHTNAANASGGVLNPGALTPTLAPQTYVTMPAGLPAPAPATLGANPDTPTLSPLSSGAGKSPTATATAHAIPTGTLATTPTPTLTPPPATGTPSPTSTPTPTPPPPTPTSIVTPTPTSMGGMTATPVATQTPAASTPVATQTPAAITPAPTGNTGATATASPAAAPTPGATSTPSTMASARNILLAGISGRLILALMSNTPAAGISVVTLLTMLSQFALYLAKRRRHQP
jgi:hypothetical protein